MHEWSAVLNIQGLERDRIRICSRHFSPSDFMPNGKLKESAIPHVLPEGGTENDEADEPAPMGTDNIDDDGADEVDALPTADCDMSVTDMSVNDSVVGGDGDLSVGAGGGEGGTVDSALRELEEAANNIPSGSKGDQITVVRRKLRSLRVKLSYFT